MGDSVITTAENMNLQFLHAITGNNYSNIICAGNPPQTFNDNNYSIYVLEIHNSNNINLSSSLRVNNVHLLSKRIMHTGNNMLSLSSCMSVSSMQGWANVFLRKYIKGRGTVDVHFETVDSVYYLPADFTFYKINTGSNVKVFAMRGTSNTPCCSSVLLSTASYINCYRQAPNTNSGCGHTRWYVFL